MTEVFVDTSFWIAYLDRHDHCHELASASFPTFLVSCHLVTTNFIVHETLTYLNCSLKVHVQAMTFLETVRRAVNEECLMVLRIDEDREERAMDLLTHYSDKDFSVVDCMSFVITQDRRIQHVLGFDDHFTQMGFILGPPFPSFPFEN